MSSTVNKPLHYGLWVVQVLLAFAFGMAGLMKLGTSAADLIAQGMAWAGRVPEPAVKVIGLLELLGAVGLILPSALRIVPVLTAAAAGGLVLTMAVAAGEHAMAGEMSALPVNFVLGGMAAFVLWGRLKGAPITKR
jgi:putative oxidoreductase